MYLFGFRKKIKIKKESGIVYNNTRMAIERKKNRYVKQEIRRMLSWRLKLKWKKIGERSTY